MLKMRYRAESICRLTAGITQLHDRLLRNIIHLRAHHFLIRPQSSLILMPIHPADEARVCSLLKRPVSMMLPIHKMCMVT